ncbi:MAG: hypothetical protein WBW33_28590, partial [Bryobacteraceae bacterium]
YQRRPFALSLSFNAALSRVFHENGAVSRAMGTEWAQFPVPIFQQEFAPLYSHLWKPLSFTA